MEKLNQPSSISKDFYPQKAKGMSFFAFIFTIFIYTSIFYVFNLSPSKLFHNTKFWFFISNSLIIIILVDYGAFSSSSKDQHLDLDQEYIMRRQKSHPIPTFYQDPQVIRETRIPEEEEKRIITHQKLIPERRLQIVPKSQHDMNTSTMAGNRNEVGNIRGKPLQRSTSEINKRVVIDESKNIIRRVETEKFEAPPNLANGGEEEDNDDEYAKLSNEELNRRVEEFIQRFNQQIRLQRVLEKI